MPSEITDEMVEAARKACFRQLEGPISRPALRAIILAALAARPAPEAGSVVERLRALIYRDSGGDPVTARDRLLEEAADLIEAQAAAIAERDERIEWLERERDAAIRRINEIDEYAFEATKAITHLTGGGSECFGKKIGDHYTADLAFCAQRIRDRKQRAHERFLAENKRRREADARAERLERQNKRMTDAILSLLAWDARRSYPLPYAIRDPLRAALQQEGESDV